MKNPLSIVGGALCLIGVGLLLLGLFGSSLGADPSDSQRQQASEFLSASAAMETAASIRDPVKRREAIAQARGEYQSSRGTIEATQSAAKWRVFWLKVGGALVAAVGAGMLVVSQPK